MSDTHVWVDFNDMDDKGVAVSLRRFATGPVGVGDWVTVSDGEGTSAVARVLSITDSGLMRLKIICDAQ